MNPRVSVTDALADILINRADEATIQARRERLARAAAGCAEGAIESVLYTFDRRAEGAPVAPSDPPVARFGDALGELDRAWWDLSRAALDGGAEADRVIRQAATDSGGELVAATVLKVLQELHDERRERAWASTKDIPVSA